MDDDGVVRRPALQRVNLRDRLRVQRIGRQPINRLRGQRDHLTRAQQLRRAQHRRREERGRVRGQNFGWRRDAHAKTAASLRTRRPRRNTFARPSG